MMVLAVILLVYVNYPLTEKVSGRRQCRQSGNVSGNAVLHAARDTPSSTLTRHVPTTPVLTLICI